jgi:cobalt/nickel transport system permease protein
LERKQRRDGGEFVGQTISGVTGALQRAIFDQEMASQPGILQSMDPRSKLIAVLALLLATGLAHHIAVVLIISALVLLLAGLARLSLASFLRRAWLGIPVFAMVVVIPSLFMLPGTPLVSLSAPPFFLAITDNGASGAALFVARVGTSVSLALLLVSTTRWMELLGALRVLRAPESIVLVLSMTYRYLFLLLHAANNLFLARASRTVGWSSGHEQRRWAAGAAATLMGRSMKMSSDVLMAMQSRGFAGEVRLAAGRTMRDQDWLVLSLGIALAAGAVLLDRGWG